jgi:hypothetical protein
VDNNFVNSHIGDEEPPMPARRRSSKPAKTLPLRKSPPLRRTSAPVIDLGDLNERLGYFVRRMQIWIFQDFIRRLARIDISPAQFSVLVVIGGNPGLSQSEIAGTLGIERALLARAKALAAQHETGLKQRLGPEQHRLLLETLREF